MSTDKVLYTTTGKPIYVIQFEDENDRWQDAGTQNFWSYEAALKHLHGMKAAPYPYRIVERATR